MSRSNDLVYQLSFSRLCKVDFITTKSWIILATEYLVFAFQEIKCVPNK
jgi:hypothetical protein